MKANFITLSMFLGAVAAQQGQESPSTFLTSVRSTGGDGQGAAPTLGGDNKPPQMSGVFTGHPSGRPSGRPGGDQNLTLPTQAPGMSKRQGGPIESVTHTHHSGKPRPTGDFTGTWQFPSGTAPATFMGHHTDLPPSSTTPSFDKRQAGDDTMSSSPPDFTPSGSGRPHGGMHGGGMHSGGMHRPTGTGRHSHGQKPPKPTGTNGSENGEGSSGGDESEMTDF